MRNKGSSVELEHRRHLVVERLLEGYSTVEVADFLDVDPRSVRRWFTAFQRCGIAGLAAQPIPGRPSKLNRTQEKILLRWLADNPMEHGFPTELWTGSRIAQLIQQEWGIQFHPKYLSRWLRSRGFTPQRPQQVPRERDPEAIGHWLATEWPRIKKKRVGNRLPLS